MSEKINITFLGTGTSQGVPVIACSCEVCISDDARDKRLRCSILIETEGKTICVDSGPDFRQQMLREKVQDIDAVVYTHEHKDHIAGTDDIRAFNFKYNKHMNLYADHLVKKALHREFPYAFEENPYPGVPLLNIVDIENEKFEVEGVEFQPVLMQHFKLPVFGYRIGDFAYCTDVNFIAEEEKAKLKGLKVLVLTALRREKHNSHYNLEEALEIIAELKPEQAYLTHISHLLGKHSDVSLELPANVAIAHDGLKISI